MENKGKKQTLKRKKCGKLRNKFLQNRNNHHPPVKENTRKKLLLTTFYIFELRPRNTNITLSNKEKYPTKNYIKRGLRKIIASKELKKIIQ